MPVRTPANFAARAPCARLRQNLISPKKATRHIGRRSALIRVHRL
jgi:hypothetical protein